MSYFAGAEKKDERVLVPDLGSLTSVYDRCVCVCVFSKALFKFKIFWFDCEWFLINLMGYLVQGQRIVLLPKRRAS